MRRRSEAQALSRSTERSEVVCSVGNRHRQNLTDRWVVGLSFYRHSSHSLLKIVRGTSERTEGTEVSEDVVRSEATHTHTRAISA